MRSLGRVVQGLNRGGRVIRRRRGRHSSLMYKVVELLDLLVLAERMAKYLVGNKKRELRLLLNPVALQNQPSRG